MLDSTGQPLALAAMGNLAVQRLYAGGAIHAKLQVGSPNDPAEHAADRVAHLALHSSQPCSCTADDASPCAACRQKSAAAIRRKPKDAAKTRGGDASALRLGSGRPLPSRERAFFEPRLDADLSGVRLHAGNEAMQAADRIGARAFTLGNDIAFNRGEYQPHSSDGRMLLAHELAHVAQSNPTVIRREPLPPAKDWNQSGFESGDTEAMLRFIGSLHGDAPAGSMQAWPPSGFRFPSQDFGTLSADLESWRPKPTVSECPGGACHQVAEGFKRAAEERARAQHEADLLTRWGELHVSQHEADLGQQAKSLPEDIQTTDLISSQLRIQLLDRTIGGASPEESLWAQLNKPQIVTTQMRDTWVKAQQAALIVDTLLAPAGDQEIGTDAAEPLRTAFTSFYASLIFAQRDRDQREAKLEAWRKANPAPTSCPGGCHSLTKPEPFVFSSSLLEQTTLMAPLPQMQFKPLPAPAQTDFEWPSEPGKRETQLNSATAQAKAATDETGWRGVLKDYRWATGEMDTLLLEQVPRDSETAPLIEQFDYTRALLQRQLELQQKFPQAVKVQAVFYPRGDLDFGPDETGMKCQAIAARGIPWQFYLVHTPVPDENIIPADFEWQLWDLTAPKRDQRYVKSSYKVNPIENYVRSMVDPRPITRMNPPRELFEALDHSDFFPKGMLYWNQPHGGGSDQLETTEPWTFTDWLTAIGMAVAVLGSLAFAPFSTPMLIAVGLGTAMSITGRALRLQEMQEHGILTDSDVSRFYWDVALDLMSAVTLGLGRVAIGARAAGSLRAASLARGWFMLKRAELGMDIINVGVVAHDFVKQYDAIMKSNLPPEKKSEALQRLTMFAIGAGLMTTIPVYTGLRDLRHGATLTIDIDPANPKALIGSIADEAAEAATLGTRGKAKLLQKKAYTNAAGERHTVGLWSDGRITRCSDPPCDEILEGVVGRIDDLRAVMHTDSAALPDIQALLARARGLREEAAAAAKESAAKLAAKQSDLVARARELESEMDAIELRVYNETPGLATAAATPDPKAIRPTIDALLKPGAKIPDAPVRADVDAAVRRFELGHPLPGDLQLIVSDAVAEVRAYLTLKGGSLSPGACAGACGLAKGQISLAVLGKLEKSGVAVQVDAMSSTGMRGVASGGKGEGTGAFHQFVVVRAQGEGGFIIDPTFSQFLRAGSANVEEGRKVLAKGLLDTPEGAQFVHSLVSQGFVPLTRENAALYTRALGLDVGPVGSLQPGPVALLILSGKQHHSNLRFVSAPGSARFVDVTEGHTGKPLTEKELDVRKNVVGAIDRPSDLIHWYDDLVKRNPTPTDPVEAAALELLSKRVEELREFMPRYQAPGHPWAGSDFDE